MTTSQNPTLAGYLKVLELWGQVVSRPNETMAQKFHTLLTVLRTYLDMEVGIISHVSNGIYEIIDVDSKSMPLQKGQRFSVDTTFCARTLNNAYVTSFHNAGKDDEWSCHPAYKSFALESYIGTTVKVNGEIFGTLNFSSPEPKSRPFSTQDHQLVQMTSQWIGSMIEIKHKQEKTNQEMILLRQSNEHMRAQTMQTMGFQSELIRRIIWELKYPAQGMASLSTAILSMTTPAEGVTNRVRAIKESSEHVLGLLDNFSMASSTIQSTISALPKNEKFSPYEVLEEVTTLLAPVAHQKNIYLDITLEAVLPEEVSGDLLRFRQILMNLIGRSIQMTEQAGVFVRATLMDSNSPAQSEQAFILIEVEDHSSEPWSHDGHALNMDAPRVRSMKDTLAEEDTTPNHIAFDIACHLIESMNGELKHVRLPQDRGNLLNFFIPVFLNEDSMQRPHGQLCHHNVWTDSANRLVVDALAEACQRFGSMLVEHKEDAEICILDADQNDLDERFAECAQQCSQVHLIAPSSGKPLSIKATAMARSMLDRPLRHRQLLEILREEAPPLTLTQDLSVATIPLAISEQDLEYGEWMLPPSFDEMEVTFKATTKRPAADTSRLQAVTTEDVQEHRQKTHSLEMASTLNPELSPQTAIGIPPSSVAVDVTPFFDEKSYEDYTRDHQGKLLFEQLIHEFFFHSAKWLEDTRAHTSPKVLQARLRQGLLELQQTAREIGLLRLVELSTSTRGVLIHGEFTLTQMRMYLDQISDCLNQSFDAVQNRLQPSLKAV